MVYVDLGRRESRWNSLKRAIKRKVWRSPRTQRSASALERSTTAPAAHHANPGRSDVKQYCEQKLEEYRARSEAEHVHHASHAIATSSGPQSRDGLTSMAVPSRYMGTPVLRELSIIPGIRRNPSPTPSRTSLQSSPGPLTNAQGLAPEFPKSPENDLLTLQRSGSSSASRAHDNPGTFSQLSGVTSRLSPPGKEMAVRLQYPLHLSHKSDAPS
ncbi:hypothetical protein V2W45_168029 [Cenococcum geophilum]